MNRSSMHRKQTLGCINKNMNNNNNNNNTKKNKTTCRYRGGEKGWGVLWKSLTADADACWIVFLLFKCAFFEKNWVENTDFIRLNTIAAKRTGIVISERSEHNRGGGWGGRRYDIIGDGGEGRGRVCGYLKMNDLFCCTDWYHFLCKKKKWNV